MLSGGSVVWGLRGALSSTEFVSFNMSFCEASFGEAFVKFTSSSLRVGRESFRSGVVDSPESSTRFGANGVDASGYTVVFTEAVWLRVLAPWSDELSCCGSFE